MSAEEIDQLVGIRNGFQSCDRKGSRNQTQVGRMHTEVAVEKPQREAEMRSSQRQIHRESEVGVYFSLRLPQTSGHKLFFASGLTDHVGGAYLCGPLNLLGTFLPQKLRLAQEKKKTCI